MGFALAIATWVVDTILVWSVGSSYALAISATAAYTATVYAVTAAIIASAAYGIYALSPDMPTMPSVPQLAQENKQTVRSAINTKRWHYGRMRIGGTLAAVFENDGSINHSTFRNNTTTPGHGGSIGHITAYPTGKHKMLHMFLALGCRELTEIEEIWIGEEKFWDQDGINIGSSYIGKYWAGYVQTYFSDKIAIRQKAGNQFALSGKFGNGTGITISKSTDAQLPNEEYWLEFVNTVDGYRYYRVYDSPEDCAAGTGYRTFANGAATGNGGPNAIYPEVETHIMGVAGTHTTVQINAHLGTSDQVADEDAVNNIDEWTDDHRLQGLPYLYIRAMFDADNYSGIPAVTVVAKGVKIYDPRTATTAYSDNWALCVRDFMTHEYGFGCDTTEVNNDSIIAAANISDEIVMVDAGAGITSIAPASADINITSINPYSDDNTRLDIVTSTAHSFVPGNTVNISGTVHNDGDYHVSKVISSTQFTTWRTGTTVTTENGIGVVADSNGRKRMILTTSTQHGFQRNEPVIITGSAANDGTYYPYYIESENICRMKVHSAKIIAESGSGTAAHTGSRYIANGTVDTKNTPKSTLEKLLTAGAGAIVWTQGKHVLHPGAYSPALRSEITKNDLRGPISVTAKTPRSDLFNRVAGTYISPTNNWTSIDFQPVENAAYEVEDNGEQMTVNTEFPFTTDDYRCQRLAKIQLERSRQPICIKIPGKLTLLDVGVMQNVPLTFPELGWDKKEFKITKWNLDLAGGAVDIEAREEAAASYDWNNGDATLVDPAPNTNLEDPWALEAPTNLIIAEEPYLSYGEIKKRVVFDWDDVEDASVTRYVSQYRLSDSDEWIVAQSTDIKEIAEGTTEQPGDDRSLVRINNLPAGSYDFRVKAISANSTSVWAYELNQTIGQMAVQEAINMLPDGGGVIHLEEGEYIDQNIALPDKDIWIKGSGKGTVLKNLSGGPIFTGNGLSKSLKLMDLKLESVNTTVSSSLISLSSFTGSLDMSKADATLSRDGDKAVSVTGTADTIKITNGEYIGPAGGLVSCVIDIDANASVTKILNNTVSGGAVGIAISSGSSAVVSGNIVTGFKVYGIACNADNHLIIDNPKISSSISSGSNLYGIYIDQSGGEGGKISRNMISLASTTEWWVKGVACTACRKMSIADNTIDVTGNSPAYGTIGIDILSEETNGGGSENSVTSNNIRVSNADGVKQRGIRIEGYSGYQAKNNTVTGNTIDCVNVATDDIGIELGTYSDENHVDASNTLLNCGTDIQDNG